MAGSSSSSSEESVRLLMSMMQNEPVLRQVLRLVQNHCLSGGLHLRFGHANNVPPTPLFARHIDHYYVQFCRCAIVSFLAVGFVPYRIRRLQRGVRIPEVLPLGSYTWYVARNTTTPQATMWRTTTTTTTTAAATKKKDEDDNNDDDADLPILRIEVLSGFVKERIHVYEFEMLNSVFVCPSLLMSLIPGYVRLLQKRECVRRAEQFNSQCAVVFEQVDRKDMHAMQKSSEVVLSVGNESRDMFKGVRTQGEGRQAVVHDLLEAQRALPEESIALVAPLNQAVHSLERVLSPQEMVREELLFIRSVACAVGMPPTLVLQGSGAVGSNSASTSSNAQGWAESSENNNRELLDLCRNLNMHLELLLLDAYELIYSRQGIPQFRIVALPIFNLEQLLAVFNAELIDDGAFSAILEASWGTPLGQRAVLARTEKRKAEFVLPFRDKKEPPAATKK